MQRAALSQPLCHATLAAAGDHALKPLYTEPEQTSPLSRKCQVFGPSKEENNQDTWETPPFLPHLPDDLSLERHRPVLVTTMSDCLKLLLILDPGLPDTEADPARDL